jgi:hypothetical protein
MARKRSCGLAGRLAAAAALAAALVASAAPALGNKGTEVFGIGGQPAAGAPAPAPSGAASDAFLRLAKGWKAFLDLWHLADVVIVFLVAAALGAVIAYHPRTRQKASTIEELEQPKTFIMYALVGAITSVIVQSEPSMALVIFGIGGLMRFRTDVGPAKDTGRVILTALVGVCVGLKLIPVAVLATAFGWILVWYLERETFSSIVVHVDKGAVGQAAEAYRRVLTQASCRVLGEKKNFVKGHVTLIFTAPYNATKEQFEQHFAATIPETLRGSVDWDVA